MSSMFFMVNIFVFFCSKLFSSNEGGAMILDKREMIGYSSDQLFQSEKSRWEQSCRAS